MFVFHEILRKLELYLHKIYVNSLVCDCLRKITLELYVSFDKKKLKDHFTMKKIFYLNFNVYCSLQPLLYIISVLIFKQYLSMLFNVMQYKVNADITYPRCRGNMFRLHN